MAMRLRTVRSALLLLLAIVGGPAAASQDSGARARDEAQREAWQNVPRIFEVMSVRPGAVVADVGAGGGFFTVRLARAVGSEGRVYAVDINRNVLDRLRDRVKDEALTNVDLIEGTADDPRLPAGILDAALIVNSYHEMPEYRSILAKLHAALKPDGRLVIVEPISERRRDQPRDDQTRQHEIGAEHVQQEARDAGFRVVHLEDPFVRRNEDSDEEWLVVLRPRGTATPAAVGAAPAAGTRERSADDNDQAAQEWKSPDLRIGVEEFKRLFANDGVVVLDVRDRESYQQGHLPGAVLMTSDTLAAHAEELRAAGKPIVTYCS
jgi:ubiquinone/menaquinone biosynthesis C-methylase UbiE